MPKTHTVKEGECLSEIADKYYSGDWKVLYEHADNQALRDLRPDPNILKYGDTVVIPDGPTFTISTKQTHSFQVKREKVTLHVQVIEDPDSKAASAKLRLEVDGLDEPIESELVDGSVNERIPANSRRAVLTLLEDDGETIRKEFVLNLGMLDPLTSIRGVRQRLQRLGYPCESDSEKWDAEAQLALEAFQRKEKLEDNETPYGSATTNKLRELIEH